MTPALKIKSYINDEKNCSSTIVQYEIQSSSCQVLYRYTCNYLI